MSLKEPEGLTTSDEAGARAERLARIRVCAPNDGFQASIADVRFLLAELDRVTAERDAGWKAAERFQRERDQIHQASIEAHADRDTWKARAEKAEAERDEFDQQNRERAKLLDFYMGLNAPVLQAERDSAIASRNAWAEKAVGLEEALKACRSFLNDPEGFAGVTISDTVWCRDGLTLLDWVDGALLASIEPEVKP